MVPPSPASPITALEGQLREMYGRAAYTHKTHQKMADAYVTCYKRVKAAEIVLSAITTTSLLVALFGKSYCATVLGAICSALVAGCALYFKEASLGEQAQEHTEVGAKLWGTREALFSLLVDLKDGRSVDEVRQARDHLNTELEAIYKVAPRTDSKAYAKAQAALQSAEELFFTEEELNKMLPRQLRGNADNREVAHDSRG